MMLTGGEHSTFEIIALRWFLRWICGVTGLGVGCEIPSTRCTSLMVLDVVYGDHDHEYSSKKGRLLATSLILAIWSRSFQMRKSRLHLPENGRTSRRQLQC